MNRRGFFGNLFKGAAAATVIPLMKTVEARGAAAPVSIPEPMGSEVCIFNALDNSWSVEKILAGTNKHYYMDTKTGQWYERPHTIHG